MRTYIQALGWTWDPTTPPPHECEPTSRHWDGPRTPPPHGCEPTSRHWDGPRTPSLHKCEPTSRHWDGPRTTHPHECERHWDGPRNPPPTSARGIGMDLGPHPPTSASLHPGTGMDLGSLQLGSYTPIQSQGEIVPLSITCTSDLSCHCVFPAAGTAYTSLQQVLSRKRSQRASPTSSPLNYRRSPVPKKHKCPVLPQLVPGYSGTAQSFPTQLSKL